MSKNARKRRGVLLLVIGVILMLTKAIRLDDAFFLGGIVFVALGFGDIFYDSRYKRRF